MEPNEHDRTDRFDVTDINRRKLLQGVGAAGAIGVLGTGSAAARHKGSGPQNKCDCIDDADAWGKYDFECVLEAVEIGTAEYEGEEWLTLDANWGDETVFTVTLDEEVYDGWPNDPDAYVMEVVIDASYGECHDEYRFGFHGGDGEEGVGFGGYAKPNFADPGEEPDRETFSEDDVTGFSAEESDDQHTYTYTVNWDELAFDNGDDSRDSPGLPDTVDIEVFGGDGGEGIGATSGCIEDVETGEDDGCAEWGFVHTEGDDIIEDITVTHTKDDDPSEPITVEYEAADEYVVTQVCAFGGTANDEDEDPDGESSFDLQNKAGKQAAISNLTFCVEEEPEFPPEDVHEGMQIDLVLRPPIETEDYGKNCEDKEDTEIYSDRDIGGIEVYWASRDGSSISDGKPYYRDEGGSSADPDGVTVVQQDGEGMKIDYEDDVATCIVEVTDNAEYGVDELTLVVYTAPGLSWQGGCEQVLADTDLDPDTKEGDESTTATFEVDLPTV